MDEFLHRSIKRFKNLNRGALITVLLLLSSCAQKSETLTVMLGGDVILARNGQPIFMENDNRIDPWHELEQKGIFNEKTLFFANLESPLTSSSNSVGEMNLCSNTQQINLLTEVHIDFVSLANNHRDDCQKNGEIQTSKILADNGIISARADMEPVYLETDHGRLAVIAAESVTNSFDAPYLLEKVKEAREKAAIVIVSMHWGNEYQAGPDQSQQELAQQLADAGADVIWGQHPHILQRMEWLPSADGRDVLVLYSLGNLLADQWMLEDTQRTALVQIVFTDGKISKIEIVPVVMDRSEKTLNLVEEKELKEKIADRLQLWNLEKQGVVVNLK